jgi:hypothetical protein
MITIVASAVVLHAAALATEAPFFWIGGLWLIAVIAAIPLVRNLVLRVIVVHLAAVLVAGVMVEGLYWRREKVTGRANYRQVSSFNYRVRDPILGYAPMANTARTVTKYYRERPLYTTIYTIDGDGLRIAPPVNPDRLKGTVLMFGGSFTYGDGVANDEALPYQIGLLTGGDLRVLNLGFHGYGPQQMLAALEAGRCNEIVAPNKPVVAVYQCSLHHARRASGRIPWREGMPRYRRDSRGTLVRDGLYPREVSNRGPLGQLFDRSFLYRRTFGDERRVSRQEIDLLIEMIEQSSRATASLFGGARLLVLYWDDSGRQDTALIRGLDLRNIPVLRVSEAIDVHDPKIRIDRRDRHPSADTHRRLAEYVVERAVDPQFAESGR